MAVHKSLHVREKNEMKQNRLAKIGVTSAALLGVAALAVAGSTTANADPTGGAFRTYSAVGSDTIQDVYNGFGNGYTIGSTTVNLGAPISSWDAFGTPASIITKAGENSFVRPAGSGDGVRALSAAWNPAKSTFTDAAGNINTVDHGEVDIARSSGRPSATVFESSSNLDYVPLARDAVSVAIQTAGSPVTLPTNFTTADLAFLYSGTGTPTNSGLQIVAGAPVFHSGSTNVPLHVQLPQASSGTRSFFLGAIGVGCSGQPAIAAYVPSTIAENHADALNTLGDIAPFSAAQWIAQKHGLSSTFTGTNQATLAIASIGGVDAVTGTGTSSAPGALYGAAIGAPIDTIPATGVGAFARDVYSVIPTANRSNAELYTLVTNTLPQASYLSGTTVRFVVEDFGFRHLSYNTAAKVGQLFAAFTN